MTPILQDRLPHVPWMDPRTARLPGVVPVEGDDWLRVDEAFAGQMAERDRLITTRPDAVHALRPEGEAAAAELLAILLARMTGLQGYRVGTATVERPDGVEVAIDHMRPLITAGRLVQEDLCLMQRAGDEHVLTGACLCFPASWTLAEKIGKPLTGIHVPVASYTDDIARRVQRMFDAVRVEAPLWRMNALIYVDPTLHQPRREADPRIDRSGGRFVRVERQSFVRLPQTGAVLFAIHTWVVSADAVEPAALQALQDRHA